MGIELINDAWFMVDDFPTMFFWEGFSGRVMDTVPFIIIHLRCVLKSGDPSINQAVGCSCSIKYAEIWF
jgi:hypothetical protein